MGELRHSSGRCCRMACTATHQDTETARRAWEGELMGWSNLEERKKEQRSGGDSRDHEKKNRIKVRAIRPWAMCPCCTCNAMYNSGWWQTDSNSANALQLSFDPFSLHCFVQHTPSFTSPLFTTTEHQQQRQHNGRAAAATRQLNNNNRGPHALSQGNRHLRGTGC